MGFTPPAVPPDYSKLIFMLNSSGAQAWNPAVYDILKQLIAAVQQSQDVLTNTISNIPTSSGLTSVSVDPAGALSGNGTGGSPLAVKVDGTTITISGDKLVVPAPSGVVLTASGAISFATMKTLNTVPITVIAGVLNKVIIPIHVVSYVFQSVTPNGFSGSVTCTLRYDTSTIDLYQFGEIGSNVAINKYNINPDSTSGGFNLTYNIATMNPSGKDLKLRSTANRVGTDNGDYVCYWRISYLLVDA